MSACHQWITAAPKRGVLYQHRTEREFPAGSGGYAFSALAQHAAHCLLTTLAKRLRMKSAQALASLALSFTAFAAFAGPSTTASPEGLDGAGSHTVETRTLKKGSAIRAALEARFGASRIAENLSVTVVGTLQGIPADGSIIDFKETEAMAKDGIDPETDGPEPNGPGGYPGQDSTTHANCVGITRPGGGFQSANVVWSWTWTPTTDTNGDGRITGSDNCPCQWVLQGYTVELVVESGPLEC